MLKIRGRCIRVPSIGFWDGNLGLGLGARVLALLIWRRMLMLGWSRRRKGREVVVLLFAVGGCLLGGLEMGEGC